MSSSSPLDSPTNRYFEVIQGLPVDRRIDDINAIVSNVNQRDARDQDLALQLVFAADQTLGFNPPNSTLKLYAQIIKEHNLSPEFAPSIYEFSNEYGLVSLTKGNPSLGLLGTEELLLKYYNLGEIGLNLTVLQLHLMPGEATADSNPLLKSVRNARRFLANSLPALQRQGNIPLHDLAIGVPTHKLALLLNRGGLLVARSQQMYQNPFEQEAYYILKLNV